MAIPGSTNVAGDLSTVVRWSQMFGSVNLINIGCIDFTIMNHRALISVVISAYFSSRPPIFLFEVGMTRPSMKVPL